MGTQEFVKKLIEGNLTKNNTFKRDKVMDIMHSDDFYDHIKNLNEQDLIKLIKGVCVLEGLPDLQFGSTTRIPKILNILSMDCNSDNYKELIDWLFSNRNNPYVPYGKDIPLEIKSENEYKEYEEQRGRHRELMREKDDKRHKEAEERKRKNFEEHKARSETKRKKYYENKKE